MKGLIKSLLILTCIALTVSCATTREEKKEEIPATPEIPVFNFSSIEEVLPALSKAFKELISVFPNPTSSSATIQIDFTEQSRVFFNNFKYALIFNEKIIYENEIKNINQDIWQEVIPEHLIQTAGNYIVAYELTTMLDGKPLFTLPNVINFMVVKGQ
ncbi:MAG: hypothetical protein FWC41_09630 [Firmicutes bacterium]|nr:hypothetical protein [Bacillota bacterium]